MLRCRAARRAMLVHRDHTTAPRHSLSQVAKGYRGAGDLAGAAPRSCRRLAQAGRNPRLFHLLARVRGRRGTDCRVAWAELGHQSRFYSAGRCVRPGRLDTIPRVPADFSLSARSWLTGVERHGWLLCRAPETLQLATSNRRASAKTLDPAGRQSDNAQE